MPKAIRCILLIDDDPDDNFFHRIVIEESDLCDDVRVAESGPAALRYLTQTQAPTYRRPDIIFLDINMPGMNGFEFAEQYHKLPVDLKSRLLLMMLTTSVSPVDRQRAAVVDVVTSYYTKPLTAAMLHEIVDQHFR